MNSWTNNRRTIRNQNKTLFKVKAGKIFRAIISSAKILKLILVIIPFLLIGFFLRYLAVSEETPLPVNQGITPRVEKQQNKTEAKEYTFKQGDTFYEVLLDLDLPPQEIFDVLESSKTVYDLRKVKPDTTIALDINSQKPSLNRLVYNYDDQHFLVVNKTPEGYSTSKEKIPYDVSLRTIQGTIKNNLFDDAIAAGGNPQVILNFADIFAWDVDFFTDLRENDSFKILFEEVCKDGTFVKCGKILAAEFVNNGKQLRAYRFEDKQGNGAYYDDKGRSLAREFLKSPLRYSRISSGYTKKRFHPILKTYRPHLGVDYAAPTGTPVEAICDGKIVYIGWKGNYGKCIILKHNHIYSSYYGHLSRYAKGMKKGKRVKQGTVIGYVGSTGMSTGPHLDFRLKKRGSFINPLSLKSAKKHSIKKNRRPQFQKHKRQLLIKLEQLDDEILLAKRTSN
jgi:murein DD-endopeptidase MepM/ murein hydrolase activator NlpD